MSNVFQQGQQHMLLQTPFHQVVHQPVAQMPNLVGVQFSSNMMPYAQNVIIEAINKIQGMMSASQARIYFFNIMAGNGFDNGHFRQLVMDLSQFIEAMCVARNQMPQTMIPEATDAFITYSTAKMALQNNNLTATLPQQVGNAMINTVREFENAWQNTQASMRSGNNNMGQRPMMQNTQQNLGSVFGNQQQNVGQSNANAFVMNTGSLFQGGNSFNASVFSDSGAGTMNIASPTAGRNSVPAPEAPQAPMNVFQTDNGAPMAIPTSQPGFPQAQAAAAPVASNEPVRVTHVGTSETVKWIPSVKYPVLPTFDPNKEELKFHVYSDGTIQPVLATNISMNRTEHLSPLAITPKWAVMSQQMAHSHPAGVEKSGDLQSVVPEDVQEVLFPEAVNTVATHKESWTYAEAYMLSVRHKYPDKVTTALKFSLLTDTIIASSKIVALVKNLHASTTAAQAAAYLVAATKSASYEQDHLALRSIQRLVKRLTQRVNRFISIDMSLSFGRIDDYVEDAPNLAAFLKHKLGETVSDVFEKAHKKIILESVTMAEGELHDSIQDGEFANCQLPENEDLTMIHLYNSVVYGVVDLSTIELRAEIPTDYHSALISESSTPLLADLAKRLFNKKTAEQKGGAGFNCDRFMLRTNDGVILELSRAAFSPDNLLVALYNND